MAIVGLGWLAGREGAGNGGDGVGIMLYLETPAPDTLDLLRRIQALPEFVRMRLVGGTSLALQLGHRMSVDLDFFGDWPVGSGLLTA